MRMNAIFSPVQIILDKPEEVKELVYALDDLVHGDTKWFRSDIKYPIALKLLEMLRKVPLQTELK